MNYAKIKQLQKSHGFADLQSKIDSGLVWKLEGSYGRAAMDALKSGACMLPKVAHRDAYGNRVPSRTDLKDGTTGTYQNSVNFWNGVMDGSIYLETDEIEEEVE